MRLVKDEIRILGVDDCPFTFEEEHTKIIGCVFRAGKFLEGVLVREIEVDGFDVTDKVTSMVLDSKHKEQLRIILLDGISFGGFNIVNLQKLSGDTDLGVIAVSRRRPNMAKLKSALKNLTREEERWALIEQAGSIKSLKVEKGKLFYQAVGLTDEKARKVLDLCSTRSIIPEPIRVAHMFASALIYGESRGRV